MNEHPDNVERVGADMGQIPRDTFGEILEFRVRFKSNAHVGIESLRSWFESKLETSLYDISFIKENKHFDRNE